MPERITAKQLHEWLGADLPPVVVDVRDDDRFGGHIRGSINVPSRQFGREIDELKDQIAENPRVVFHCQLSQQRGPNCASIYDKEAPPGQNVYVLDGGFSGWASLYPDDAFTEELKPELY